MQLAIFEIILSLLVISLLVTSLFRFLKLPVIVGYIFVGILVGPHALKLLVETQDIRDLAEFGVVFLMFTIGLEFSLTRMWALKKTVFIYGGLQVFISTLVTAVVGLKLSMNVGEVLVVGGIVALSSTAIVLKQLNDQGELYLKHGLNSVGILLFQDLAVIPLLILIPALGNVQIAGLFGVLSWSFAKGILALAIIFSLGRWVLRPVFYYVADTRSLELFTLMTLLVTLASAWLTHNLGLSLALGAFLAGMMLGETEFKRQIETDIRPFRDVLLGFFFITVGMQLDTDLVIKAWKWVLLLLLALVIFKTFLISAICYIFDRDKVAAFRTGLVLAQGGEFGFAILTLALSYQVVPIDYAQVILCALLLSMALAPIMIGFNEGFSEFVFKKSFRKKQIHSESKLSALAQDLNEHVIICGYGRVGQTIARLLEKAKIPYIALDLDSVRVKEARDAGDQVCFADGMHPEVLELVHIQKARALVVSFIGLHASSKIIEHTRQKYKHIPIIARAYDEAQVHSLYQQGATEVITDTLEASLMISAHTLLSLKVSPHNVFKWINEIQHNRYDLLRMVFPGKAAMSLAKTTTSEKGLHTLKLPTKAFAIDKAIGELKTEKYDVQISAIRRGKQRISNPDSNIVLQQNDVVVLYGEFTQIERCIDYMLKGN